MVSNPRLLTRVLLVIAAGASAAVLVVWLTGGFITHVGSLRVSMRGMTNPLVLAATAWALLALVRRPHLAHDLSRLLPFLDRHATAIAVVMAASCAGTGVRFGTFAAHATDPSAYVSHSRLLVTGPLIRTEPLVRAFDWYTGAWNFSPLGYRPGVGIDQIVPTYPLGLPAVMALLRLPFGEVGAFLAVPLLAALLVLGAYRLATQLHSRTAGLVAAALTATSPVLLFHTVQPMSDVPSATWLMLAIVAARGEGWLSALAAGACLGMLGATRPNLAPLGAVVAACTVWPLALRPGEAQSTPAAGGLARALRRVRLRRAVPAALGLAPVIGTVMMLHMHLYGSPLATGYGSVDQYFSVSNVLQNVRDYSWRIASGETAAIVLTLGALALWIVRLPSTVEDRGGGRGLAEPAVIAAAAMSVLLALYLPYGIFPDWAYLRFLLPGLPVVFVLIGTLVADRAARLPPWIAGPLLVAAVAVTCIANVQIATREQAFNLHRYESRYRTVGQYLRATMPPNAAVVTFQQSGSVRYYTGVPIVRWDYLPVDLDDAVHGLRAHGLHPLLVVEDWERQTLRARFPKSRFAALDWTPRADIGETTHVWVLDPLDRGAEKAPVTDVFH